MKVGVQMYTVRESCKNTEDFARTLEKIADIGYTTVQVSGTCDYDPHWLDAQLKKNGLECVITHIPGEKILAQPREAAAEHDVFGCRYVGLGCYDFDPDDPEHTIEHFAEVYGAAAKELKACGKYFMYHNHDREFKKYKGELVIQRLIDLIPADLMGITFDTYWAQVGGADPAQWLEKLSGRIPCIHLKDAAYKQQMAVIGEGNINFDRVFEKAEAGGTQYMLVEQDDCNGEDPFDCLRRSYQYLHACGFN